MAITWTAVLSKLNRLPGFSATSEHVALFRDLYEQTQKECEEIQSKYEVCQKECARLGDENATLKSQLDALSGAEPLDNIEQKILLFLANNRRTYAASVATALGIEVAKAEYHLERLVEHRFVDASRIFSRGSFYDLAQSGREFLVKTGQI